MLAPVCQGQFSLDLGDPHSCTIGVASGSVTEDGRPLIWKTRDWTSPADAHIRFDETMVYDIIMVGRYGSTWPVMGVNEKGFALVFSLAPDLTQGGQGWYSTGLMETALGNCATVMEFEAMLDSTNITGRRTHNNFAAMDSSGEAKMYEIGGDNYWVYDANDTTQTSSGFIVRTNFAENGGGIIGIERYNRSNVLINEYISGDSLNYRSLLRSHMRDISNGDGVPAELPYPYRSVFFPDVPLGGYMNYVSICNNLSQSSAVIQGVHPDESPELSTMWSILGLPATSIAVPFWPVGDPPSEVSPGGVIPELVSNIRDEISHGFNYYIGGVQCEYLDTYDLLDGEGGGIWTINFPTEDSIFAATENQMEFWRSNGHTPEAMLNLESALVEPAVASLQSAYDWLLGPTATRDIGNTPDGYRLSQNYPNPFNPSTTISYDLPEQSSVRLTVFDIRGQQIMTFPITEKSPGNYEVLWNGVDQSGKPVNTGVYFARLEAGEFTQSIKMLYLK
ncbi:MAG: T9SS type A sorting domain-containing protein [Candidatus Marinimicrobia bacterium]|nr:T9SS type A sorting domain-containing protein [Candidatus Neomarinimicrobiota bacterium]